MEIYGSTSIMGLSGDTTLVWSQDNQEVAINFIRGQMKKGVMFFELEKIPVLPIYRRRKVTDTEAITSYSIHMDDSSVKRTIHVTDQTIKEMLEGDHMQMAAAPTREVKATRRITDPARAARTNTIGTPLLRGG